MEIVPVVTIGILAGCVLTGEVLLIDMGCLLIPFHRLVVLPNPHVNVGGHMNEMAGARHETRQPFRTGQSPLRLQRCLDRMQVIMAGPWVIGILQEHGLERGDDLLCARLWSPIRFPEIPRPQIHQRFRKQRGRIAIFGKSLCHRSHSLRISFIESLALDPLSAHIPRDQGLDVGLLHGGDVAC